MIRVLCACLLGVLLWQHPAIGQNIQRTSVDEPSMMMNKGLVNDGTFESSSVDHLDLIRESSTGLPAGEEMNDAGLASKILTFLASQNRIVLYGGSADGLDAYLRPPHAGSDDVSEYFEVFIRAKTLYDDATSIRSDRYEVNVDPLNLRWVLKLNLNQLSSD